MNSVRAQQIRQIGFGLRTHTSRVPTLSRLLNTTPFRQTSIQRTYTTVIRAPRIAQTSSSAFSFSSNPLKTNAQPSAILRRLRTSFRRSFHNSRAKANADTGSHAHTAKPQSLGARMKKLSREYGWSALGVYLALSALDFPFCYLLVRYLGTEIIGEWEHAIVSYFQRILPEGVKEQWKEFRKWISNTVASVTGKKEQKVPDDQSGWGVEEAEKMNKKDASLATQLALAYAIHKSFIFIRVPITAAITPKVVRVLRSWGWDIGKRTTPEVRAINRAANAAKAKKTKSSQ